MDQATEKQINYLTDLIDTQKMTLQYGPPRTAARQFKKARYPVREQRMKLTREQRNQLTSELTEILTAYLDHLNISNLGKRQASAMIDALKSGAWAEEAISA